MPLTEAAKAKKRAEDKKKKSSASSHEQRKEELKQQQAKDVQEVNRLGNIINAQAKTGVDSQTYLSGLEQYKQRLSQLGMNYGYDVGENIRGVDEAINSVRRSQIGRGALYGAGLAPTKGELMASGGKGGKVGKKTPGGRVNALAETIRQNTLTSVQFGTDSDAGSTFGIYDPKPEQRTRIGNVLAAGGKGWTSGQASALGFLLDPTDDGSMTDAEMMLDPTGAGKALGENKVAYWLNEQRAKATKSLYGTADDLLAQSLASETLAKKGLGKLGQIGVDMGVTGTQMLLDAAIGRLTGMGMSSMGTRTFGQSAREALANGATQQQAFNYGMNAALVEVGTEKMFDVLKIFGGGAADDVMESVIRGMAKTDLGRTALRIAGGFSGEAIEELVSGVVNPLIRSGYDPKALKDYASGEYWKETLYEGLVGGLLGLAGGGGQVLTGQNARANQILRQQDAVAEYAKKFGGTAKAVETVYRMNTETAPEDFQRGFEAAYFMGREGVAVDQAMNAASTSTLTPAQRQSAWEIGRDARETGAEPVKLETMEGGTDNGTAMDLRHGSERNPGASTTGQVQPVERSAGQTAEGRIIGIGGNAKDSGAAQVRYEAEVKSAKDLGIENGAVIKNLHVVDKSSVPNNSEMREAIKEAAKRGKEIVLVSGYIHVQDGPGGMVTKAHGLVETDGRIFVQVDHHRFTARQIAKHEGGHVRIERGEIRPEAVKAIVKKKLGGDENFNRAMDDYAAAYEGTGESADAIWDEVICDALGGMNIFDGIAEMAEEFERASGLLRATREGVRESPGTENAAESEQKLSAELSDVDSEGKPLTEQQAAFFAESKVRTDSGALKVMYRGGNTDIEVFDRRKSKSSNLYGRGFYFTDSETHAKQYGNATPYYLNITNPLLPGQHEITRAQMRAFLEAVQENDEDYDFVNYGQGASVGSVLSDLFGKGDMEMLQDVNATAIGDFVAAVELFNEVNGTDYDGIIVPTETVAFRSEQIKRTDNKKPTGNANVKFSTETPIEETDKLIAWHNMGVDALNGALELGGLAMPSWAIQPANKAHTQYGDVSVIAPRDLVDPKRNRNSMIFGGDAWTPVFPEVNYKVSYEAAEALEDEIKALVGEDVYRQIGGAALDKDNIADQFKRSNGRLSGHYARNLLLQYAYLKSTGSDIEAPTKEDDLYYGGDFTNDDVRRFVGRLTNGKRTLEKLENMSVDELFEQDDLLQTIADVRRDSYREKLKGKEDLLEKFEKSNLFSKDDIKFSTIDRMLKAARKYLDGGVQQTVDKRALQEIIDREVDQSAYEEWILQKLNGTVERKGIRNEKGLFTPSGNRRSFDQLNYSYTLANIVKAMKAQPKQGRTQFLSGPGSVRGAAMKTYKDVEQARREISRVMDAEDDSGTVKAAFDRYDKNLSDILDRMTKNGDKFDAADAVIEILQHAKTEQGIYNYMQRELKEWYNVSPELAHDIYELIGQVNALPIPYFEGKTYDAVQLDEALAIVVPDTIDADLKNRLEDAGANVLEYKAKDDTDRLRVVNSVEGAKFSRELDLDTLARENKALQREVQDLTKQVKKWKNETKRTERVSMREDDVRREAKDLVQTLNSKADVDGITARLQELGEYMMNGEPDGGGVSYETVREMAAEIAEDIVGAEQVNIRGDVFDEYQHLANLLKGKWLHISERAAADLLAETGYESIGAFNDAHKGVVRITTKPALGKDRTVQDAYYEMIEAMPGWFPENVAESEFLPRMLEVLDGLRPVYGMSDETSAHYDEAVTWAANDIIDRMLDESVRQNPKTFADRAQAKYDKERARLYQRIRRVREQGNERVERTKREYAERSRKAVERLTERQAREIQKLKDRQKEVRKNERERRDTTAIWHKIQKLGAKFRQMAEHPAQAASKHAPRELAKALQGIADVFYTDNRQRSMDTINAAIQNLRTTFSALENDPNYGIYYDEQLAEINDQVEQTLKDVPAREMEPLEAEMVYRLLRAHMHNITNANKFVTGQWAKGIWETGRDWSAEVDGASPVMKGWIGDFLNWQLRPDSFFRRISGFAKNSVGERVQKMFADGTEKMLRIQQAAYYHFRKYTESKEFDKLSKRGKKDLIDVGLKDENGKPVLLTRDMMLAVYMHLSSEQNLEAATYGGFDVPALNEYYTGKTARSYDRSTRTMNVGSETRELQNELHDLEKALNSGELSDEEAQDATARIEALEQEIRDRADAFVGQMLKVRENISKQLTEYEKGFVDAAQEWMQKSADYINAETLAMYGIEKAQVENYWPMHRNLNFVNTDMRTVTDEINLENWGSLKERVRSRAPLKLTGFGFEIDNHTKKMSQFCGYAAAQRDFNKLYNTKLTREGSSLSEKIQRKFGSEERKMGATGQQYIDAYIAAVSGADKSDATFFSVIRRNLPRATLTLNLRVAVSQLASMPTAAAEVGWGSAMKGLPKGLATAFNPKAKARLAEQDPWFWQRYRGEGGMREFADMKEERNWLDRFYNRTAALPVIRRMVNWCQDFDVFATASMWAMSESWVKDNTDLKPGTQEFEDAVSAKYADVIRKTQPNYTVTERSGLLRDKREGYKILTMYKTQSNQNLNILYDANATLMKYKKDFKAGRNGVTKEDVKDAERQFARAYTAVLLGGSVKFAILRAGANAILHAVNRYRDDDDELTLMSVLKGIAEETMSAISGMFAFGSAVYDIVHALVTGDKYYGLNESAIEALTGLAEQAEKVLSKALDRDKDVELEDVEKLVTKACNILGLPWNNGKTIVTGIVNHVRDAQNGEFLSFRAGVQHTAKKEANKIIDGYKVGAGDKVKRAWDELLTLKDGDEAKAQETMRSGIKGAYLAGDVTDKQALDLLKRYGGKDGDDAKEYLLKWQAKKETGMEPDDINDAYTDGEITKAEAVSMIVKYKGKTQDEAEAIVDKLDFAKQYGVEYGEKSIQQAVIDGDMTADEAMAAWKKYGKRDESYYEKLLQQAQFVRDYPGTDAELVTKESAEAFYKYGEPAEIPADKFMEYWNKMSEYTADYDAAGNLINGSKKQKVVNYIASLNISDAKKDALYFSQGYSAKNKPAWP